MGEAKRKAEVDAGLLAKAAELNAVPLTLVEGVVVTNLDLACQTLVLIAKNLGRFQQEESGKELLKAVEHLISYKLRYIGAAQNKVRLASPAEMPKAP